jgi:hypothetical protein
MKRLFLSLLFLPLLANAQTTIDGLNFANTLAGPEEFAIWQVNGACQPVCTYKVTLSTIAAYVASSIAAGPLNAPVVGTNALGALQAATTTGIGSTVVLANSPTLINPSLGTPASIVLTNATGLPTTGLINILQAAQEPAHTGDATNSAGSLALTVVATHLSAALPINQGGTGTESTLTGLVRGSASAFTAAELSQDVTTSGSNAATVVQIEGAAIPASAAAVATNSSKQLVAANLTGNASATSLSTSYAGTFTGALTGMTGTTTGIINYTENGYLITLTAFSAITGTSNSTGMTMTGLPAALQPVHTHLVFCGGFEDNSVTVGLIGTASIGPSGTITFALGGADFSSPYYIGATANGAASFTASGTKGMIAGFYCDYTLD